MDPAGTRLGQGENHGEKREAPKQSRFVLFTACGNLHEHYTTIVRLAPVAMGLFFAEKTWKRKEREGWYIHDR